MNGSPASVAKNPLLAEHDLQPTAAAPMSIRCPHCRQFGLFDVPLSNGLGYLQSDAHSSYFRVAALRRCPSDSCFGLVLSVEDNDGKLIVIPAEMLDFDPENLPDRCRRTLEEAIACHGANAYRAAAMMIRRLLEELCDENGAEGGILHKRLESLRTKVVLPQALFEAMDELKILGNDAAHIEARNYDDIGREEAELSIELAKEIVKGLYQLQSLVGRLKKRRPDTEAAS